MTSPTDRAAAYACSVHGHDVADGGTVCARCAAEVEPAAPAGPHITYSPTGSRVTDGTRTTGPHIRPEAAWRAWRDEFGDLAPDVEAEPAASQRADLTARIEREHGEWRRHYGVAGRAAAVAGREAIDRGEAAEDELRELDASYPLDVRAFGYDVEHGRVEFVPNCHLFPGTHGYVTVEPSGLEQWHRDKSDAERWLAVRAAL